MRNLSGIISVLSLILILQPFNANAQFHDSVKTFTITGTTGVGGVRLTGFPRIKEAGVWKELVSDESGKYHIKVWYGWKGTVIPIKEGYTFQPPSRIYPPVRKDYVNDDYTASSLEDINQSGDTYRVVIIPTKETSPEVFADISNDLKTVLNKIDKAVCRDLSSEENNPNQPNITSSRNATYVQDYGILLTLHLNSPTPQLNPALLKSGGGKETFHHLFSSLVCISKTRHIPDNEKVIITIISKAKNSQQSHTASLQTTLVNIKAFAKNTLDNEQFAQQVRIFAY